MNKYSSQHQAYYLKYTQDFRCIGADCAANCCNSWPIKIDSQTLDKYKEYDEINGAKFLDNIIATDAGVALIKHDKNGRCPFLSTDNLCGIVVNHGEAWLGRTCRDYPRMSIIRPDQSVLFLTNLSCPEAVKQVISSKASIERVPGCPDSMKDKDLSLNHIAQTPEGEEPERCAELQNEILSLIKDRRVTLQKRLTTLSLLIASSGKRVKPDVKVLLSELRNLSESSYESIPEIPTNPAQQFALLSVIVRNLVSYKKQVENSPMTEAFFRLIDIAYAGFGVTSIDDQSQQSVNTFKYCQDHIVAPFLEEQPQVEENLLCHYIIRTNFPFQSSSGEGSSQKEFYKLLTVHFLFRSLLGGYSRARNSITYEEVSDVIYVLYRIIEHNTLFVEYISIILNELQIDSPTKASLLYCFD